MKYIIKIIFFCILSISIYGQNLIGVASFICLDKSDGTYYNIKTNRGDEVLLKVSYMDSTSSIYADENYCLVISKIFNHKSCYVSAAYKKDGIWIQDYENSCLFYIDTGVSATNLTKVTILDGTKLQVEYTDRLFEKTEQVKTTVSLYAHGFYDHHMDSYLGVFFLKDKKLQMESVRKGPLYEYKKRNGFE